LAFAALLVRLVFALTTDQIHHPDEVFQYLEQGHRLVFGYGLIPWEYRFGTRSWLIPLVVAGPLALCKLLHVDQPTVYIPLVKSLFCLLSVSLVFAAYTIGRSLVSERAGRLAAVFCAFWYELIYFAPRPLADIVSSYFLISALACLVQPAGRRQPLLFGFTAGLSLATRIQFAPVLAFLGIVAAFRWDRRALLRDAAGFAGVVLFAGAIDRLTWGGWFISYYNNVRINVAQGVSLLFGTEEPSWYLDQLLGASGVLWTFSLPLALVFFKRLWIPIICLAIVVGTHSALPHKEYRFVFPAVPLLLLLTAAAVTALVEHVVTRRRNQKLLAGGAVLLFGCVSLAGCFNLLPDEDIVYPGPPFWLPDDKLRAVQALAQDEDLAAVFIERGGWTTYGGYYYLHRDVPVYFQSLHFQTTAQAGEYVSHILCDSSAESVAGFTPIGHNGSIEIRKRVRPPRRYPRLPSYSRHVFQPGIDAAD
jgi:hypothetical protein